MLAGFQLSCRAGTLLTVLASEYLKVCGLGLVDALADGLLVGAVDFAEVFDALVLRVAEICLFVLVSAIALRLGGILDVCCWSIEKRKRREVRGERGKS